MRMSIPLSRLVTLGASVAMLIVAGAVAVNLYWAHENALQADLKAMHNTASSLSRHAAKSFEAVDLVMRQVEANLADDWDQNPVDPEKALIMHRMVKTAIAGLPQVRAMIVVDRSGHIVADSDLPKAPSSIDLNDRPYFRIQKTDGGLKGLYIGAPLKGRQSGKWFLSTSRRLNDPDGTFAGVVAAIVDPLYFNSIYKGLDLRESESVTLSKRDGTILVREPLLEEFMGHNASGEPLFKKHLSKSHSGTFYLDKARQGVSYASAQEWPLIVDVRVSGDEIFSDWADTVYLVVGVLVIFAVIVVFLVYLLVQELKSREATQFQLALRTKELERSNGELDHFAHAISHDLQEPLRTVGSYLQLLDMHLEEKLDDEAKGYIEQAVDGSKRMSAMIRGLLEYSRISTRGQPLEMVQFSDVIEEAVRNLHSAISERHAVIRVVPTDFSPVLGDKGQLIRLLQNILSNALKYCPEERQPEISILMENDDDAKFIQIQVQDNGIGIEPKFHERIFQLFQRLHTLTEFPGSGIGLASAKRIVERHGGEISVRSEKDHGACFIFSLQKYNEEQQIVS